MSPVSVLADIRGRHIHYLDWQPEPGTQASPPRGRPIMIVHGNTHAGGVYSPLAERLAPDHRVITVDLRGHGLSDQPASYTWAEMRDDITGLIDHLQLDHLTLVAHSRGAGVAMLATAARADRVRGLVAFEPTIPLQILDPAMDAEARRVWSEQRIVQSAHRRADYPSREAAYAHYQGRGAFKGWHDAYLRAFVEHCIVESPTGGFELASPLSVEADLVRARLGMEGWDEVFGCPVPVLAVFGGDNGRLDGKTDPVAAIARLFPNSKALVMPGATHSGPMEQPAAFEAAIREFDASLDTATDR